MGDWKSPKITNMVLHVICYPLATLVIRLPMPNGVNIQLTSFIQTAQGLIV